MPGRPHHSNKMKRCVDEVVAKGHSESSAYAICTTSLQNAGEAIYAEAHEDTSHEDSSVIRIGESLWPADPRNLHLLGATGQVRYEELNGRRHLVVPIVALMEGVIHPVNAETPEFVSADVLRRAAASWIGKPVTLGHPKKHGTQCSASDAEVRRAAGIGVIVKSEMAGKKLLQEAWVDEEKAKALHPELYDALAAGGREEVSVGAFVVARPAQAEHNGKRYKADWLEAQGDHLAFLPGGRGACSCEMGCGTHRAAQVHLVTAESIEPVSDVAASFFAILAGKPLMTDCPTCDGTGQVKQDGKQADCPTCDGTGEVAMKAAADRALAGARHSTADMRMIQAVHDHAMNLGAKCDRGNLMSLEERFCRQLTQEERDAIPEADFAGPHRSFFVVKPEDVAAAASSLGRAGGSQDRIKARIIEIAYRKGAAFVARLPEAWKRSAEAIQPERVRREGTRWALYSADGKRTLAHHKTEADAREHLGRMLAKCG